MPIACTMKRLLVTALIGCIVLAMVWMGFGISRSLRAESNFHAFMLMREVVEEYCETQGKWPPSWESLAEATSHQQRAEWTWPRDCDQLQSRIHIDFSIAINDVCRMTPASFSAMRPIDPCYEIYPQETESFISRICSMGAH